MVWKNEHGETNKILNCFFSFRSLVAIDNHNLEINTVFWSNRESTSQSTNGNEIPDKRDQNIKDNKGDAIYFPVNSYVGFDKNPTRDYRVHRHGGKGKVVIKLTPRPFQFKQGVPMAILPERQEEGSAQVMTEDFNITRDGIKNERVDSGPDAPLPLFGIPNPVPLPRAPFPMPVINSYPKSTTPKPTDWEEIVVINFVPPKNCSCFLSAASTTPYPSLNASKNCLCPPSTNAPFLVLPRVPTTIATTLKKQEVFPIPPSVPEHLSIKKNEVKPGSRFLKKLLKLKH